MEKLIETLLAIDKLTCNCPCMSLQAQKDFERCPEAAAYKSELAGVIIKIRDQARAAISERRLVDAK